MTRSILVSIRGRGGTLGVPNGGRPIDGGAVRRH